jgi:signal transduction histidine kinase/ligand-binding sensor domain-containing protein
MPNFKNVILVVQGLLCPVLLLCLLLISPRIEAQEHRLLFHSIGVNEGLSHSSVYFLLQDSRGFIWAGTADGLNRYDGRTVKVYRPDEAAQNAEAAYIRDRMVEDKNGNIWYVAITGIYCWDKMTEHVALKKRLNKNSVVVYFLKPNGDLWLQDVANGFFCYNIYNGATRRYPYPIQYDPKKYKELKVATDDVSTMWSSLYNNGEYYSFDINTGKYKAFRYKDRIALMSYENGWLWLSDNKTMDIYKARDMSLLSTAKWDGTPLQKCKVFRDKTGYIWLLSCGYGLYCMNEKGQPIHKHTHETYSSNTISSDNVTAAMQDRSGNLWVATDGGGISRASLKENAFGKFPVEERDYPEMKDFFTSAIYERRDGKILFGNNSNGLSIYDRANNKVQSVSLLKNDIPRPHAIYEDVKGVLWLGYNDGVGYMNNTKLIPVPLSVASTVYRIINRGDDTLLLCTSNSMKMLVHSNSGWKEADVSIPPKLRIRITDIIPDGNNAYWVALSYDGLMRVKCDNSSFVITDSFLNKENVKTIHRDEVEKNILWLASKRGLWKFDTKTGKGELLNTKHGLGNANTYGVLEDEYHNLWISTNGGLSCYSRKKKAFTNYTYNSGLQSNEFNSSSFHKGVSGTLYFGGVKGFNWLTGKSVVMDTVKPQLIVTAIIAGDSVINPFSLTRKGIEIPNGKNSLSINMAVPEFTRPEANYIKYQLEGLDKEWNTSQTGEIRYANLQPGNYTLRIYGVGSNQAMSEPLVLQVKVIAPFWQEMWFRILLVLVCIAIITLLIYSWYRRKVSRALRELEQEKMLAAERNRISRDLHDDIGGAITKISLLSELIPMQHKGEEKMLADVKVISATARDVSQSMSDIVWALHTQHDTLESLLSYLREKVREFLEPIQVKYKLEFPDDVGIVKLSGEQRRNILLVMKEALNNAVKYAESSLIKVSCEQVKRQLVFKVIDDGKGFDLLHASGHGNGLRNMQKRMDSIGGDFVILQQGKGTEIIFSVPI